MDWKLWPRTRCRYLELTTALHTYDRPGRNTVAAKIIDFFGNDTMTLVTVHAGWQTSKEVMVKLLLPCEDSRAARGD